MYSLLKMVIFHCHVRLLTGLYMGCAPQNEWGSSSFVGNLKLACLTNLILFIGSFPCLDLGLGTTRNSWKIRLLENCGWPGDEQLFRRESTSKVDIPYILVGCLFSTYQRWPQQSKKCPHQIQRSRRPDHCDGPGAPRRTGAAGVGIRCGTGVSLGGSGHYGFLLVRSAGKIPPNTKGVGKKVKNLWTSKKPWERNSPPKMVIVPNWTMSIVGVVTENTFTPQPGLDSEAASCWPGIPRRQG